MIEAAEPEIDPAKFEEYRDQIDERDVTPDDFGRIAAQTAKQVILQRIREAERDMMFEEYQDRVGELITGIVQQKDSRYTLIQLRERVEALLPKGEQVEGERYEHNQRIKAVIKEVSNSTKGPSIIVSRRDPELIKSLFELEVPEIADGLVEIANVAREPGYRSKIAVVSHADGVDPVGACVGPRGSRVRMVVSELRGEKIDIIPYNDEPARFVAKALSPARVREVLVDDDAKQATVVVPDDQLSLAIGREGQNARLAARLTGWRIDIRSETEFARGGAEGGYEEEETSGRCAAILTTGRRCPNAVAAGLALLRPARPPGAAERAATTSADLARIGEQPPPEQEAALEEIADELAEEAPVSQAAIEEAAEEAVLKEAIGEAVAEEVVEEVLEEAVAEEAVDEAVAEQGVLGIPRRWGRRDPRGRGRAPRTSRVDEVLKKSRPTIPPPRKARSPASGGGRARRRRPGGSTQPPPRSLPKAPPERPPSPPGWPRNGSRSPRSPSARASAVGRAGASARARRGSCYMTAASPSTKPARRPVAARGAAPATPTAAAPDSSPEHSVGAFRARVTVTPELLEWTD